MGVEFSDLLIVKYKPLRGNSYIPLPKKIANTRGVINVQNEDNRCFLYSLLAHKFPITQNPQRPSNYINHLNHFNVEGFEWPMPLDQIPKFEKLNSISINVFGFSQEDGVFPRHLSEYKFNDQANLLLISNDVTNHYCYIKDLDKFLHSQTKNRSKAHYCVYCLHRFKRADLLAAHNEACRKHGPQKIRMPEGEKVFLSFKNFEKKLPVPYYIVADFECILDPTNEQAGERTLKTAEHKPASFCFAVINYEGNLHEPPTLYRGSDAVSVFLSELKRVAEDISVLMQVNQPLVMSREDEAKFKSATICHICETPLEPDLEVIVRDHCHLTGKFRGAAHQDCNVNYKYKPFIPVVLHNLRNYDSHLIMQAIGEYKDSKINCIANHLEKYVSFSLDNLAFVDSLQFCNESLDRLAQNLRKAGEDKFKLTRQVFSDSELEFVLAKGHFPYDYFDSLHKLDEKSLPPRDAFFNKLTDSHITEEDYLHCERVWSAFNMQNFGDYHDLYLKTDVLLLADVFQNFRALCLSTHELDALHFLTAPGFSFASALKKTGICLELLTDLDMHLFCEESIRGGVSTITKRYAKANNPYLSDYNPNEDNSYILYLDANNLYGYALSQPLPVRNFKWVEDPNKIDVTKIDDNSPIGYFLEVDLIYPKELHDSHSDYPLAPESMSITEDMLSPYCKDLLEKSGVTQNSKIKKLVPNLKDKIKYKLHYRNLKYYLTQGLVLSKIHRAISFEQEAWLKPYILSNTEMRAKATTNFDKNFFKLLNNSVYGKCCENKRKQRNVKLVQTEKSLIKLSASAAFKSCRIFNEELVGVEMAKTSLFLDKPIYTGVAVLELSKLLMYQFYYDVLKAKYGDRVNLCFTDTDSLLVHITTDDVYVDMTSFIEELDTSDYPVDHSLFSNSNKKVIGKFKDELNSIPISEFIGLKSKMYSILDANGLEKSTAKGVKKSVAKKLLRHNEYKRVLVNQSSNIVSQTQIRSDRHRIFSLEQTKLALSAYDDKRYILADGFETLAFGHRKVNEILRSMLSP